MKELFKEIFSKGYIARARRRAQQRKSPWNLLLFVLGFGAWPFIAYGLFRLMWLAHVLFYPEHDGYMMEFLRYAKGFKTLLFMLPLIFAALPFAIMLANAVVWSIPQIRGILDKEARGFERAFFKEAMTDLGRLALIVVPISLLLSFLGAVTLSSYE